MQNMSVHSQRRENIGIQAILQDQFSFFLFPSQFHLLHSLLKVIHTRNRRLGDRFRESIRDVEKEDKNASEQVAKHFSLANHSKQHMVVCGLSLHQGITESHKILEQKFVFQIGTLYP